MEILRQLIHDFDDGVEVLAVHYGWAAVVPEAKQSTRFTSSHAYTAFRKKQYVNELALDLKTSLNQPIEGCVRITVLYCFPWRLKDIELDMPIWEFMDKRPDIDNLLKPTMDALKSICLSDDAVIVEARCRKVRFQLPCLAVMVEQIRRRQNSL